MLKKTNVFKVIAITLILSIAFSGCSREMRKLKRSMAEMTISTDEKALISAVESNKIDKVKKLLDKGTNPNIKDKYDLSLLELATYKGNIDVLKYLIDNNILQSDVNKLIGNARKKEIISYLISKGAKISNATSLTSATHIYKDINFVKALVENGAKIDEKDYKGKDSLTYAKELSDKSIFNYLLTLDSKGLRKYKAKEKAKKERLAKEKAEKERLAKEKAEKERLAKEKAEKDRLAKTDPKLMTYELLREKLSRVCSTIGGSMNSSGHCYIPSGDIRQKKLDAKEKPYRAELYRALDSKYENMEREEICKAVGGWKHSFGCWINDSKNGLQEDINKYLSERKVKRKAAAKNKLQNALRKYANMSKEEASKYFTKKTGLYFIPTKVRNWKKSSEICKKEGMYLADSKLLTKHYNDVSGIYGTQFVSTFVSDNVGDQLTLNFSYGKIDKRIYSSIAYKVEGTFCKKLTKKEEADLKEKYKKEEKLKKQYGADSVLSYLQKVVETTDNTKLGYVNKYSKFNNKLGDAYANFYAIDGGGYGSFLNDSVVLEYRHDRDWSKNVFKWAFKADLGERKSYMKGHNTPGITKSGLTSFFKDLKQQPFFKALKNKSERSFRNGHAMIVSGEFKDKKGNIHRMDFVFRAKSYSIYIDKPNIRH